MGVPALPLPTGGATHVFEVITVLLALQLIVGREEIWLPRRLRERRDRHGREVRHRAAEGHPPARAPLAPAAALPLRAPAEQRRLRAARHRRVGRRLRRAPFTGLDTLPALGVVLVSLGVLLEDFALVVVGVTVGAAGVLLEFVLGEAALNGIKKLF